MKEENIKKVKGAVTSEAESIIKGRVCFFCKEVIDPEKEKNYFKAIIGTELRDFHKACYNKYKAEKSNIRIRIR